MTELKTEGSGTVLIADDVLATIAGTAALEADGVAGLAGHFSRKQMAKGVSVNVAGRRVSLALAIVAKMGSKLHEVSAEVQQRVKTAIETMTGLDVVAVNVRVGAVAAETQKA